MGNTFTDRILEEAQELAIKVHKLNEFMRGDIFPTISRTEKDLLYSQHEFMMKYLHTLGKRLEFYGVTFTHKQST